MLTRLLSLFCLMVVAGMVSAQDFDSSISGDSEVFTPDFECDGVYYHITDPVAREVAVMNNHLLYVLKEGMREACLEGLFWEVDTYSGDVEIPSVVNHDGTAYSVVKVLYGAFANSSKLKSIILPETVREVRPGAFGGCPMLESVTFPESIRNLNAWMFLLCDNLKSLDMSRFEYVGMHCVTECGSLEEIIIQGRLDELSALYDRRFPWEATCRSIPKPERGLLKRIYVTSPAPVISEVDKLLSYSFFENELEDAVLYVPEGAVEAYRGNEFWNRFRHIEEGDRSGIELTKTAVTESHVEVNDGIISITGEFKRSDIFDIYGRHCLTILPNHPSAPRLPAGIYIVKTDNDTPVKISVM